MRVNSVFAANNTKKFKQKLLRWGQRYDEVVFLDSNGHHDKYGSFEAVMAIGSESSISLYKGNALQRISSFKSKTKDWIFGYLTYDLKNELEPLRSNNHDGLGFDDVYFFQPKKLIFLKEDTVEFQYLKKYSSEIIEDFTAISTFDIELSPQKAAETPKIKLRTHKDVYLNKIGSVLKSIQLGDIYEVNICQEFFAEDTVIDPLGTFERLNEISEPPFAVYLRLKEKYALCASPERYLRRKNDKVVSQPIKGTAPRSEDTKTDLFFKEGLRKDPKERSENIMITDLVRNDLSKHARKGSVQVEELCGIYTFKQVHQMISTISASVPSEMDSVQLLENTFPMGSMTGAPKFAAMELIEKHEETKRGLYSGAIGYFDPEDNFDFNVVIRSILYNSERKYVSFSVGSAITAKSNPYKEYQECLLKAKAMRNALEQK